MRHGDYITYKHSRCRCLLCTEAARKQQVAYMLRRAANAERPLLVPADGVARMLRELRALGYPCTLIAERTGLHASHVRGVSDGRWPSVSPRTRAVVSRLYADWKDFPGPSRKAATYANKKGWQPPASVVLEPVIDMVAVDRALDGDRVPLTDSERDVAVHLADQRGMLPSQISDLLGMNYARVKSILAGEAPKKRGRKKQAA